MALARSITCGDHHRAYVEQGYIASRPYLSSAPVAGQFAGILVDEGTSKPSNWLTEPAGIIGRAFPGMLGKPLNLRDLEPGPSIN